MRELPVRRQQFESIERGEKTDELRINDNRVAKILEGEEIRFVCRRKSLTAKIGRVRKYSSAQELFQKEHLANPNNLQRLAPGYSLSVVRDWVSEQCQKNMPNKTPEIIIFEIKELTSMAIKKNSF